MTHTSQSYAVKWPFLALALALITLTMACQLFSGPAAPKTKPPAPANPANPSAPAQPGTNPTAVEGQAKSEPPKGDVNITKLDAGLEQYESYHQHFAATIKGTYKGQPYEYAETVERDINGKDSASLVITSGSQPLYLYTAHLGSGYYSQQKADGPCRASEKEVQLDRDPATRLPQVNGAQKVGDDAPDGAGKANHVQFDAKSLVGLSGTAQGEAWIAEDGALLKYTLTQQINERDFTGTRTWEYALSQVNQLEPIHLPAACQPILNDVPALPDAAEIQRRPGFMRYASASTIEQARQFYLDQLSDWTPLPGTQPRPDDPPVGDTLVLAFARPNEDGSGRLLVIQLTKQAGKLDVIVQSATTKKLVQVDSPGGDAASAEGGSNQPVKPTKIVPSAALPEDLPKYPGAKVALKRTQMVMLQTGDSAEKVAEFYKSALEAAGWTMDEDNSMQSMISQTWSKDGAKVILAIANQAGATQIVLTAIP